MSERENNATVGAMMLVAGGVIGAGLALLFAPQSGKKTRKQIVRYSKKVRNEAEARIQDTVHSLADFVEDLNDRTSEMLSQGEEVAEEWRRQFVDAIESGQKSLEKQKKKLSKNWD
ncbi:YtxH domain-containing protein [Desulfuromonas sp. KJ2020]|uniref:YtxH domain-containing protein n=1 Tax=Desulfuromonas sp. KJ2020 TaxID=2919173 RepID=UPI0020A77D8E|nr:YtxH domain-containing protein [Desulfuromonas sp. KJ2020]MCP3176271.1 YtxH domain-containing protein [Desulfuromonas sp. KJ2020]MDW7644751.1 YtxH domain-containing protein [Desulfuromonadales bacterium]MDW7756095.1 YtxH domain-containing protein [Desulfuromonadales bacterium]